MSDWETIGTDAGWEDVAPAKPESMWQKAKGFLPATTEFALGLGSGVVAAPVAGLAGLAGSMLPGKPGQGADWVRRTQDALTYEPESKLAQTGLKVAGYPFEKLAELGDYAGGKTADVFGPTAGAGVNAAIQAGPMLVSPLFKTAGTVRTASRMGTVGQLGEHLFPEGPPSPVPLLTPEQVKIRAQAKALGYELTPGQETGKKWQTNLEAAMRDNPATAARMQQIEARNQALTNALAGRGMMMAGGEIDQGSAGSAAVRAMKEGAAREAGKTGAAYQELLQDVPVNLEAQRAKLEAIRKDQARLPAEQQGGKGMAELDTLLGDPNYSPTPRKGFAKPAVDINADDVVAAVRKLGGISVGDEAVGSLAKSYPFSPDPRLGPVWARPKYGTSAASNTIGGHSLDRMAEKLHDLGYIDAVDPNLVMEALTDASTGTRQRYSAFRDVSGVDPLANAIEGLVKKLGDKDAPPAPRPGYIRDNPEVSGTTAQDLRSAYGSASQAAFDRGGKVQEGAVYARMKSAIDDAIVTALPKEKAGQFANLNEKWGLDKAVQAMAPDAQQTFLEQLYRGSPDQFYTFLGLADPKAFSDVSRGFITRIIEQATDSRTRNIDAPLLGRISEKYAKAPDVKGAADVGKYLGGGALPLLRDIGKIGREVLAEKVGNSGTTPRAIYSHLLGGGGIASGAAIGGSLASIPGAVVGALLGQYGIPKAVQSVYLSDMLRGRLTGKGAGGGPSLGSSVVRGLQEPGVVPGLEMLGLSERRQELLRQLLEQGAIE